MDKSWNFILKESLPEEQKLIVKVFDDCGLLKGKATFSNVKQCLNNMFGGQTYDEFVDAARQDLNIKEQRDLGNADEYLLSRIIIMILKQDEERRVEFCKKERFVSTERKDFVREFNSRFYTSNVFKSKLPGYGLTLLGYKKDITQSTLLTNTFWGMGGLTAAALGGPIGLGLYGILKILSSVFANKLLPVYTVIVCFHLAHAQAIDNVEKAKSFVQGVLTYADKNILSKDNKHYRGYHEWSEARLTILLALVRVNVEFIDNERLQKFVSTLQKKCEHKVTEFISIYYLKQLSPYADKLIDYLYGIKKPYMVSEVYSRYKDLTLCENGKQWLVDYSFPETPVNESTYFLVDPVQEQHYALTCLYVELKGFDSREHCLKIEGDIQKRLDGLARDKKRVFIPIDGISNAKSEDFVNFNKALKRQLLDVVSDIKLGMDNLLLSREPTEENKESIDFLMNRINKARELTFDIPYGYSRPWTLRLGDEIKGLFIKKLSNALPSVSITCDLPEVPQVSFGRKELEYNVFGNIVSYLCQNAFDEEIPTPCVHVGLVDSEDVVTLRISHNGKPFEKNSFNSSSVGLLSIANCMEHYHGRFFIDINPRVYDGVVFNVTYVLTFKK